MFKKTIGLMVLTVGSFMAQVYGNPIVSDNSQLASNSSPMNLNLEARCSRDNSRCQDGKDGKDGRNGRDGRDGRDCSCSASYSDTQIAYFFMRPSDVYDGEGGYTIDGGDSILWDSELFTFKTDGINVKSGLSIDINDSQPFNFLSINDDFVISNSGIYDIQYTVNATTGASGVNYYTMELRINDSTVPGSTFTANLIPNGDLAPYPQQLFGQVLTYIPAGGNLELVNVTAGESQSIDLVPSEDNGNLVSILIRKIADVY